MIKKQVWGTDRCVNADLEVLEIKIFKSSMLIKREWIKRFWGFKSLEVFKFLKF